MDIHLVRTETLRPDKRRHGFHRSSDRESDKSVIEYFQDFSSHSSAGSVFAEKNLDWTRSVGAKCEISLFLAAMLTIGRGRRDRTNDAHFVIEIASPDIVLRQRLR